MTTWYSRTNRSSPICELRHNAKYTAFSHDETAKRLQSQLQAMQLPIQGWTFVTSFGIVGGMSALLTPIREAAVARVVNLLRSASNSLLIGSGIAGVTVGVGCLVYVGKCSSLMQDISKYEDASRRWRGLFEETTRVMNLPNQNSQLSFKDFDLEVSTLLSLKKELDKLPKTVNEDYEYARKVLNRDFEQQDWTWWETLYPPPRG